MSFISQKHFNNTILVYTKIGLKKFFFHFSKLRICPHFTLCRPYSGFQTIPEVQKISLLTIKWDGIINTFLDFQITNNRSFISQKRFNDTILDYTKFRFKKIFFHFSKLSICPHFTLYRPYSGFQTIPEVQKMSLLAIKQDCISKTFLGF